MTDIMSCEIRLDSRPRANKVCIYGINKRHLKNEAKKTSDPAKKTKNRSNKL